MDILVLPALLVLLSAMLRSLIVNKNGTAAILAEIGLGLPVDLAFVTFAVTISAPITDIFWLANRSLLIVGALVAACLQLGFLYKPGKEYMDAGENLKSFGLWLLNVIVTYVVFAFLVLKVVSIC